MSKKNKKQTEAQPPQDDSEVQPDDISQPEEQQPEPEIQIPKIDLPAMLAEMTDKYQRLGADYVNYQKRAERQIDQAAVFAKEAMMRSLLPVLDNIDHTMEKGHTVNSVAELMQAVQIVFDQLKNTLQGLGLQSIEVKPGSEFNPNFHEAMLHEETADIDSGSIVRELAKGYIVNDRAIRPAKVSVAKAPAITEPESEQQ